MRILIFHWRDIEHPWAGGAEVNIHEQAKLWVQAGHNVTMLCGRFPRGRECAPRTEIDGVQIIRRGGRFSVYLFAAWHYLRHLRGQFDVAVDISNGLPFFTPLYCGLPKVIVFNHVHLKQWFTEIPWLLALIGYSLERWAVRLFYRGVAVVAISESTRAELSRVGIAPKRAVVIRPGLDHRLYSANSVIPEPMRLVHVGRLRRYKRLDILIRVVRDLAAEFPALTLDMVGIGEDRADLEALAEREGVADRITFHGFVSHEAKISLLRHAWAFVTPSANEGWGVAVLEANACGVPAVAFDVPGLRESIRNQQTGLLASSYAELCDHVRTLLRDERHHEYLSQGAVDWAAQFHWAVTSQQMLDVLARLVPEPAQAGQAIQTPTH